MSERHRALPSWMAKKEGKVKETEPLKSTRKRKTARAAFYCMNERELVDAAAAYLTSEDVALLTHQKVEEKAVDTTVKMRGSPVSSKTMSLEEESSDCGDARGTTYVSETDLDITEVETVPYSKSPPHQGPEGQGSRPVQDPGALMNVGLGPEKKDGHSQMPAEAAEEDDALQLVREIFFT